MNTISDLTRKFTRNHFHRTFNAEHGRLIVNFVFWPAFIYS